MLSLGPFLFAVFLLIFFIFVWRFYYSSTYARSWDIVDFALALDRYDLLAMQPHFPGYPYFILGAKVVHVWMEDPVRALAVFNILLTGLSSFPIYFISRRYLSRSNSLLMVLFLHSISYIWIITTEPMSEGAAIAVLWGYLWSLLIANERDSWGAKILPLFLFSILMGIRISFLPFGFGILFLWFVEWRRKGNSYLKHLLPFVFLTLLFQFIWIMALVVSEGSFTGFITLALGFTEGHFTDWGGTVNSHKLSWINRAFSLIGKNLLWTGFFGQNAWLVVPTLILIVIALYQGLNQKEKKRDPFLIGLGALLLLYAVWVFFAQNIEKARHISPLIGPMAFMILLGFFKRRTKIHFFLLFLVIVSQAFWGAYLVKEQASELPATYQLAHYLEQLPQNFVIYTWEETRVLQYLNVPYNHTRIYTYDLFLQELGQRGKQRIFITNHVLNGFERQVGDLSKHVNKVKTFKSNPIFDPVYHEITLYEWLKE